MAKSRRRILPPNARISHTLESAIIGFEEAVSQQSRIPSMSACESEMWVNIFAGEAHGRLRAAIERDPARVTPEAKRRIEVANRRFKERQERLKRCFCERE